MFATPSGKRYPAAGPCRVVYQVEVSLPPDELSRISIRYAPDGVSDGPEHGTTPKLAASREDVIVSAHLCVSDGELGKRRRRDILRNWL
jgi:hypothetical protein